MGNRLKDPQHGITSEQQRRISEKNLKITGPIMKAVAKQMGQKSKVVSIDQQKKQSQVVDMSAQVEIPKFSSFVY